MGCNSNPLLPIKYRVESVFQETSDVKTFRVVPVDGGEIFDYQPGQ